MNEGFTIKCNKCGKETIVKSTKFKKSYSYDIRYSNQNIKAYSTNMEESFITCKCGNEMQY